MKKLIIFTFGFAALVSIAFSSFAAGNTVINVRASQRSDGTKLVDIHYDLTASAPRVCEVCYSIDGGLYYSNKVTAVSGELGADVPPGIDRHIVWDANVDLPDVQTECRIRIVVTFWVGYSEIPEGNYKMVSKENLDPFTLNGMNAGSEHPEKLMKSISSADNGENDYPENRNTLQHLSDYFQKRCCRRFIVQSDSAPFLLNTLSDEPESPPEPDIPPGSNTFPPHSGTVHCPTMNEWGMIVFFILLVTVSISKIRRYRSRI